MKRTDVCARKTCTRPATKQAGAHWMCETHAKRMADKLKQARRNGRRHPGPRFAGGPTEPEDMLERVGTCACSRPVYRYPFGAACVRGHRQEDAT